MFICMSLLIKSRKKSLFSCFPRKVIFANKKANNYTNKKQIKMFFSTTSKQTQAINQIKHNDMTAVLDNLSLEQATELILRVQDDIAFKMFMVLNEEYQRHVFPLLKRELGDRIFMTVEPKTQEILLTELEAYSANSQSVKNDPNSPNAFFFTLKRWNALASQVEDKLTYFITADKITQFNIKPYKYQRKLMEKHMQCIADGINKTKTLYHPIILAYVQERDSLTILDGQHRWNALKRIEPSVQAQIRFQIDVILLPNDDEVIMQTYKSINTSVPIDHHRLQDELRYIALVERIKKAFPGIRSFTKELKEPIPQHIVVDSWLKEELHYRELLQRMKEDDIIEKLEHINNHFKNSPEIQMSLSLIDGKICKRENMYLGIQWPAAIDILEGKTANIANTSFFQIGK